MLVSVKVQTSGGGRKNLRCGGNQTINHWEQCSRPCSTEDYFSQQGDKFQNLKQKFSSQIPCIMYWVFFFDAISAQSAERSCRSRIEDSSRRPRFWFLLAARLRPAAPHCRLSSTRSWVPIGFWVGGRMVFRVKDCLCSLASRIRNRSSHEYEYTGWLGPVYSRLWWLLYGLNIK
jgi:hypothetical protein